MKIAVFDSKNTERFLGTLDYTGPLVEGRFHRIAYLGNVFTDHTRFHRPNYIEVKVSTKTTHRFQRVSPLVTERTEVERMVLTTSASISDLRCLNGFTLPRHEPSGATSDKYSVTATEQAIRAHEAREHALRAERLYRSDY